MSAGVVPSGCRAAEEAGGAGEEGCRAGPAGERDADAQRLRRSEPEPEPASPHRETPENLLPVCTQTEHFPLHAKKTISQKVLPLCWCFITYSP